MEDRTASASEAELEILKALWRKGPGTVRDVIAGLRGRRRKWAYTTVQTLLNRLEAKGYVRCDRSTMPQLYEAQVTLEQMVRLRLKTVADELCDGMATPLVMALAGDARLSKNEIAQLRELLERIEPRKKQRSVQGPLSGRKEE